SKRDWSSDVCSSDLCDESLDDREILVTDGIEGQGADAGDRKDHFHQEGAGDQYADLQADHRDQRAGGVTADVSEEDVVSGYALRSEERRVGRAARRG